LFRLLRAAFSASDPFANPLIRSRYRETREINLAGVQATLSDKRDKRSRAYSLTHAVSINEVDFARFHSDCDPRDQSGSSVFDSSEDESNYRVCC